MLAMLKRSVLIVAVLAQTGLFTTTPTRAAELPLPTTPAEAHAYFEKAFNAGDLDALMKMYDDRSILVGQPGHAAQGLAAIRESLAHLVALKLPISVAIRNVYQTEDMALIISDWVIKGRGADGKEIKLVGTTADVFRRQAAGNWIVAVDNPFGTASGGT